MKFSEIQDYSIEELQDRIKEEKEMLQKLEFAHVVAPIENPMKIRAGRRFIAQLNTALRRKQYEQIRERVQEAMSTSSTDASAMSELDFLTLLKQVQQEASVKVQKKFIAQLASEFGVKDFAQRRKK